MAIIELYQQNLDNVDNDLLNENLKHFIDLYHYKPGFYYDLSHFNKLILKFNLKTKILIQIEDYLDANLELKLEERSGREDELCIDKRKSKRK